MNFNEYVTKDKTVFVMPKSTYGLEQKISRYFEKKGLNVSIVLNSNNDGFMWVETYPEYTEDPAVDVDTPIVSFKFKYNGETPSEVYKTYLKNL